MSGIQLKRVSLLASKGQSHVMVFGLETSSQSLLAAKAPINAALSEGAAKGDIKSATAAHTPLA